MAEVKVLLGGYFGAGTGGRSCSTIALVRDGRLRIVIDPGTARRPNAIVKALAREGLRIGDVNVVFITHHHTDHNRFAGMFKKAKVLDYYGWWSADKSKPCSAKVSRNIRILKTPGHSYDSVTMLVRTAQGTVAVCGDVFWKQNFPKRDPYATDLKKLAASRKKILAASDFIVPGHGAIFPTGRTRAGV